MKLKADLRALVSGQPTANLALEIASGSTTLTVDSTSAFSANNFILVGNLATDGAEIHQIQSLTQTVITLTDNLINSQSQDTSVTVLDYNQIVFYYTASIAGVLTPLATVNINPDNYFTTYDDVYHSVGYAYYSFYNSITATYSSLSNAVPYAGFADNSVKVMLDRFYVQITNREKKLIKDEDVIGWLNEAYANARNRLNLNNRAYNVPTPQTINVVAGTAEYSLPDQFFKIRTVNKASGAPIDFISLDDVPNYNNSSTSTEGDLQVKYYLRNNVIGFAPTPTANTVYYAYYMTSSSLLASYIDYIDLPANNHYFLLDYLLYRAAPIVGGNAANYLQSFSNGLNNLVITSHKQDGEVGSFNRDWRTLI